MLCFIIWLQSVLLIVLLYEDFLPELLLEGGWKNQTLEIIKAKMHPCYLLFLKIEKLKEDWLILLACSDSRADG